MAPAIYIDSPLAARAAEIFQKHPECYDEETYRTFASQEDPSERDLFDTSRRSRRANSRQPVKPRRPARRFIL
jgi:Cft2 family RNA processing exonuclease